ncbi:MAG: thermonuclease family protein [Methylococcales bacterium]|nr:thermonuclease family protein [Methylococcales bacterium]
MFQPSNWPKFWPTNKAITGKRIGLLLAMLTAGSHADDVYFWRDSRGQAHYSDRGHDLAQQRYIDPGIAWLSIRHVIDGDTIVVSDNIHVRLLSINTPEIRRANKPGDPGGKQAKAALTALVAGQRIRLEYDAERKDRYGRTLAQVFTESDVHVNAELLRQGWAMLAIHPPNLNYLKELTAAQQHAEQQRLGIWAMPRYQAKASTSLNPDNDISGWQRLVGQVQSVKQGRKYLYLNLPGQVAARIALKQQHLFPNIKRWAGKTVEIRGWPRRQRQSFVVPLRHGSDILILH